MQNNFEITFEGDHIRVLSDGDKDYDFAERQWTSITDACRKHNCYNILGISHTTAPMEAIEGYDHARLFEDLGIDDRFRIAWVEFNDEARDMTLFVETVLINRGLPGRLFASEQDAKAWLLS
jgi:hypothetical protein